MDMRRKDRKMDEAWSYELIDQVAFASMALRAQGENYSLPLSIIRKGQTLYFHSAQAGRKVEALKEGQEVSLSFVRQAQVPKLYTDEEIRSFIKEGRAVDLIKDVFTMEFESVIVYGPCQEVLDPRLKRQVMKDLCQKYTPDKMEFFDLAAEVGLAYTKVYQVGIDRISGKKKEKVRKDGSDQ